VIVNFMWFVPLFSGGIILWILAHLFAPVGYEVKFGRVVWATLVLRAAELLCDCALKLYVGDWAYLIHLLLCVLVVRRMLWLTPWRSFFVAVVYFVCLAAAYIAIGLAWGNHPR
jgi:hypothetical protein